MNFGPLSHTVPSTLLKIDHSFNRAIQSFAKLSGNLCNTELGKELLDIAGKYDVQKKKEKPIN